MEKPCKVVGLEILRIKQIEGEKSVEYLDRKKLGIGIKKGDKK